MVSTWIEYWNLTSLCILPLYKLYMSKFVVDNQEIKKGLGEAVINAISDVFDYTKEKNNVIKQKYASF